MVRWRERGKKRRKRNALEVEVHECHHGATKVDGAHEFGRLREVVIADGGRYKLAVVLVLHAQLVSAWHAECRLRTRRTIGLGSTARHQANTTQSPSFRIVQLETEHVPYLSTVWSFFDLI